MTLENGALLSISNCHCYAVRVARRSKKRQKRQLRSTKCISSMTARNSTPALSKYLQKTAAALTVTRPIST